MARKYDLITELYGDTLKQLTDNHGNWTAFLRSACYNYKCRFDEQVLIYAQRPSATAVLELEDWNKKFGRWVNKGATGIAVFDDEHNGNARLKHYFDIADTHESRISRSVPLWNMREGYEAEVIEGLENAFGELESKDDLAAALICAAHNATADNMPDYLRELMYVKDSSFLGELDDFNVEVSFRGLIQNSVAYMLLHRCGLNASEYLTAEDFQELFDFSTPETLNILGVATSDIAEMGFREIARTVSAAKSRMKLSEKEKLTSRDTNIPITQNFRRESPAGATRRTFAESEKIQYPESTKENTNSERSFDDGTDLYKTGRLQSPEPVTPTREKSSGRESGNSPWEVRLASQKIPQGEPGAAVRQSVDNGQAERSPDGNRADSQQEDGASDRTDEEIAGRDGAAQRDRPNGMGGTSEQYSPRSGGNHPDVAGLQLEYYDRETEDKSLPFFHSDDKIKALLLTTPHLKASKSDIAAFYALHGDNKERTEYIKSIFNNDYTEILLADDSRVGYKTMQNVLHMWEGSYLSRTSQGYYDWGVIANYFQGMILLGELRDISKPIPSIDGQMELFAKAEEAAKPAQSSAFVFSQEIIDYAISRGAYSDSRYRIYEMFQNGASHKEIEKQIKSSEGIGGSSPILIGTGISDMHDGKGLLLTRGFGKESPHILLTWAQVTKRIGELIKADRYLNAKEKTYYPTYLEKTEQARQEAAENAAVREILSRNPNEEKAEELPAKKENARYEYHLGDTVYLGSNEYEILAFDEDTVRLYDNSFPLLNKELLRDEFDRKVRENPMNDHLRVSEEKGSPLWQEYSKIKAEYPDCLVMYQLGDFFELMGDDAKTAAELLNFVLTTRDIGLSERVPMCGIPSHSLEEDMQKLLDNGCDIALHAIDEDTHERKTLKVVSGKTKELTEPFNMDAVIAQAKDILINSEYVLSDELIDYAIDHLDIRGNATPTAMEIAEQVEADLIADEDDFSDEQNDVSIGAELTIDDRKFEVDSIDGDYVSLKDTTFQNSVGFPIFRKESVSWVREHLAEQEQPTEPLAPPAPKPKSRVRTFDIHPEIKNADRHNYHISDDDLGHGGAKTKFQNNVAAIRTLQSIEMDNRFATPEEQEILSRYVGWGGLPQAFDEKNEAWANEFTELYTLLSPEEYASARASTLNAHYTSPVVIKAMYQALANMGFQTGNILEPACGIGNFFGLVPDSMQDSKLYGVEIDGITGGIAQQLYQKNSIAVQGFEDTDVPDSFFDVAIGNVPFGSYGVTDKKYDKHKFLIHDYFFAKTLDKVRPNGVIAFISSKGTLDKQNPAVRKYIAQRADLLGAIRLPNTAFKANAGTEVTTDVIFLQKRDRMIDIEPDWVHLGMTESGVPVNSYFVEHPDMILGEMLQDVGMYGNQNETTCNPYENADLDQQLAEAIQNIHAELTNYEIDELDVEDEDKSIPADPTVRNFSYTLVDGDLYYRENSRMYPTDVSVTAASRIKGMLEIRDCVRLLIEMQTESYPEENIRMERGRLNRLYDNFTQKYGLLNSRANSMAFSPDSSFPLLCSLEVLDENSNLERKADMFTKRTIKPYIAVTSVDTASEALAVSISEKACVDLGFMAGLMGGSEKTQQIKTDLAGVIFKNPTSGDDPFVGWETADEYLSGNVRIKLQQAKAAAEKNTDFTANVAALERVQLKELTAGEINVRLGTTWMPEDVIEKFTFDLLDTPWRQQSKIHIIYSKHTGEWNVSEKSCDRSNIKAYNTFGTQRINAYKIIEDSLNLRDVRIFDTIYEDGKEKRVLNKKETAIAQDKQDLIKQKFQDWIWADPDRRERICRLYNDKFNSIRPREYDGSHILFVGMNPEKKLRTHQINAVARAIYGGNTLLGHCVGAGKTYEMVATAMESKRLGLCSKSMFVVPNNIIGDFAADFLDLYPSANILMATKKDFEAKNRKKFCARIATGDYDAVLIGHSSFEKIPVSMERQQGMINQQIYDITEGISEAKANDGARYTIKQMEKTKKSLQEKLKKLTDQSRKDDLVTFEELGIDRIFIDEADMFKNLFLYTKMRNIGGIAQTEAQKSSDLFTKTQYLDELTGNKGVIFATGTPVSNSMAEMYTMQRYLQYDTLAAMDLVHFDAWASQFGETVTSMELKPEGTGFQQKTRFSNFYNLPELMAMFKEVADIQTADMLDLPVPKANYHTIAVKPSEMQKEMVSSLADRAEAVRNGSVDASVDNVLLITNDGRKLALDQRLINPMLPDFPDSKVNACVGNVHRIWEETKEQRSAQLIFCDLSTPKNDGTFSVYDDIREKLLDRGIPENEIAFIHETTNEAQKKELFAKVRKGQIRVLLGSTFKMGAGTNVQDELIALHDLDCPWRPRDLEQRRGRIVRQGNNNKEVDIFRYVTERTFDSYLYQMVENKQRFISQVFTSKSPARVMQEIDEASLNYAEIKALATGNPLIIERCNLETEVTKLKMLNGSHLSQKYELEDKIIKRYPQEIKRLEERIAGYKTDMAQVKNCTAPVADGISVMKIGDVSYTDKKEAGTALIEACKQMSSPEPKHIGCYRGFEMYLSFETLSREYRITLKNDLSHSVSLGADIHGNITRLDNALDGFDVRLQACTEQLDNTQAQMTAAKAEADKPFPRAEELKEKSKRLAELTKLLKMDEKDRELLDGEPDEGDETEKPQRKVMYMER